MIQNQPLLSITTSLLPGDRFVPKDIEGSTVVVIDVLRAGSTILAALGSGARRILTVAEDSEALALSESIVGEQVVLGGERHGVRIEGFALGNSPAEYTPQIVGGKTVILTTSNGTRRAAVLAVAGRLIWGTIRNARAVAQFVAQGTEDVALRHRLLLACAGTDGGFSGEDALAAGMIVDEILRLDRFDIQLDDASRFVLVAAIEIRDRPDIGLAAMDHARYLESMGFGSDIEFCARRNVDHIVPIRYVDGIRPALLGTPPP